MVAGTKQETPGSEMKDDLLLTVRAEVRVAGLVPFLQLRSHVVIQRGPGDTYTRGWFYHKRGTVEHRELYSVLYHDLYGKRI